MTTTLPLGLAATDPTPAPWEVPPAIAIRRASGMSVEVFAALCRPLIGRPGPSTLEEDHRVAEAMLGESATTTESATTPESATTTIEVSSIAARIRAAALSKERKQ